MPVRTAIANDLPVLRRLFRRASLSNPGDAPALLAHPEALVLPDTEVLAGHSRVAVTPDGTVLGFATTLGAGPVRELEDLFVDPEHQGHGIGAELVADAASRARQDGAARLEVTANPHASRFYGRVGFERDGEVATALGPGIRMHLDLTTIGRE
ncbi:MAG TPA: GNAT family N-acetyltransferase [Ornithinibacter sp.]|nr:GNAT family N-acetyltransferase [Ornithinibacter sp.]